MTSAQLYLRLLRYVKPYWKVLALSMLLLALLALLEPVFPALMQPLLDEGFTNRNETFIQWIPLALVALFLIRGVLGFTSKYASSWVANRVITDLRFAMFSHSLHLPTSFYDHHSSGRIASHISNNPLSVTGAATMALNVLVRDTLTILALLGWLLWLNWKLTSITLALFPVMAIVVRYFNKRMRIISKQAQHGQAQITHIIEEAASNNKVVKIFTGEQFEKDRFHQANETQRGLAMRATVAESAVTPIVQLLASLSVAAIVAIALNSETGNTTTAGEFMSFLTALLMLLPPIKRLTDITNVIQRGLAAAEIIFDLIDKPTERWLASNKDDFDLNGNINFENVRYSYNNKKTILDGFSLEIEKGKTVALIGKSGSGKTTITNLLAGLYCISDGNIYLNKKPISEITLQSLRKNIAMVSQDIRLFNDTIMNNVAYTDTHPSETKVLDALEAAHAMEFVNHLKDGIHTQIGQNGVTLSGGQRQRIAIARAFYKNAPILILDEATSALDTESERAIQRALLDLAKNRTTIAIAHRLSTIERADKIIVMEEGQIKESGTHQELLELGGYYAKHHQLQLMPNETSK
jgi:subfamily B ATP-binding cassette protein MsbA